MTRKIQPPFFLRKFLRLFVNIHYLEEIEGDLEELYHDRVQKMGKVRAGMLYIKDVFQTLRPYRERVNPFRKTNQNTSSILLLNNLKISTRALLKQKGFTLVNIIGLAIGVASSILLTMFIKDELSFDRQFADGDRIHRLVLERIEPGNTGIVGVVPHSFASVIPKDFAEVERTTVMCGPFNDMMITYKDSKGDDHKVLEQDIFAVDSNFFKIFSFLLLKGDRQTLLKEPRSMVLTRSAAERHFGTADPMGKWIRMSGSDFVVTGVCEDVPDNTHFKFGILMSINTIERFNLQNFNRVNSYCYLKLKPAASPKALEAKFPKMVELYAAADFEKVNKTSWAEHVKAGYGFRYFLCPLHELYLYPENIVDFKPSGNLTLIKILICIDVLILVIACINFINLATARSSARGKEVGVRKVVGSHKINLIFQFLTESFIIAFFGVLLAIAMVYYAMPFFNSITAKHFHLDFNLRFVTVIGLLTILVGLMAGIYPAFVMSSFRPVLVLKGNFIASARGKWIRNGLVVFQFTIAIMLMIGTMVIYQQMRFIQEKDLGYNTEELLLITGDFHMKPDFANGFIEELKKLPQVVSAAGSLSMPSDDGIYRQQYRCETMPEVQAFSTMLIGDNYAEVMGFEKLEGRLFSETTNDSLSVIVNEAAVRQLGLSDPVGKTITYIEQTYGSGEQTQFTIIGVVKDFNYTSLHLRINPLVIQSNEIIFRRAGNIVVRLHPNTEAAAIKAITAKWKEVSPQRPFQFKFMNHLIDNHYKKEQQVEKIITVFSILSIVVACIGLFGLSAYAASSRSKEIGIRKVVGARTADILVLLSADFTKLVVVSFLIAAPFAWYLMENWWLHYFAYRVEIEPLHIFLIGGLVLAAAWFTVGFQSVKASLRSPVNVIREQ